MFGWTSSRLAGRHLLLGPVASPGRSHSRLRPRWVALRLAQRPHPLLESPAHKLSWPPVLAHLHSSEHLQLLLRGDWRELEALAGKGRLAVGFGDELAERVWRALPGYFLKLHQSLAPGDPRLNVVLPGLVGIDFLSELEYNSASYCVRMH